jgi:hypothetical protein
MIVVVVVVVVMVMVVLVLVFRVVGGNLFDGGGHLEGQRWRVSVIQAYGQASIGDIVCWGRNFSVMVLRSTHIAIR